MLDTNANRFPDNHENKAQLVKELFEHGFHATFQSMNNALYITKLTEENQVDRFVDANEAACGLLGYRRDEFLKLSPIQIIDPTCVHLIVDELQELLNGKIVTVPSLHVTKEGKKLPVEVSSRILNLEDEKKYVLSMVRDISHWKNIELLLEQCKNRMDSLFTYELDIVFSLDSAGKFSSINSSWEFSTGYSRHELLGKPFTDIISPEDLDKARKCFQDVLGGSPESMEIAIINKNNQRKEVSVTVIPIIVGAQTVGVTGIARDISLQKATEKRLRESELRFKSLFEHNIDAIIAFDVEGRFAYMNAAAEKVTGYSPTELIGRTYEPLIVPERREGARTNFEIAQKGTPIQVETAIFSKEKKRLELSVKLIPIYVDNHVIGIHCICKDITLEKRSAYLLDGQNRILEMIAKDVQLERVLEEIVGWIERLSPECLCSILLIDDHQTTLTHVCAPSLPDEYNRQVTGVKIGPAVGSCGTAAYYKKQVIVTDIASDPLWADYRHLAIGHGLKACWSTPILDPQNNVLVTFAVYYKETRLPSQNDLDLVERATYLANLAIQHANTKEKIQYVAYHDPLTELPNLRLFQEQIGDILEHARRNKETVSILFIDLDRFKQINDSLGHDIGDLLLQKVSSRLMQIVGNSESVYRHSGDEFIVLLHNCTQEQTEHFAQSLIESLSQPYEINGLELVATASIGISLFPLHGEDAKTLQRRADNSMYHAKRQGKNNFQLYTNQIDKLSDESFETEIMLRKAIERQEFVLHYQPKVDLVHKTISGVEALIRWYNPKLGMVSPAKFIPLAEETGLIVAIGEWVLQTACKQNKAWQDQGLPPMVISVNLSIRQFYQPDLVEKIAMILRETGLDPKYLELEITETMTMNVESATNVLYELKELGVNIAIDDFGMGYSSLNYLKRLPTDCLKIDQSFVHDITQDSNDRDIVSTIIAMGHTLKKKVIAEGVETKEQLQFLQEQRCDEIQGYYFSKPVTAEEFPGVFERLAILE
ncbi:MAG: EAL domain-containing protein [Clostridia bacterium]